MKKELAVALPLALGAPMVAHATCATYNSSSVTTVSCTTTTALTNLSSDVTIQASAGVALKAEDGSSSGIGANEIAISSCHDSGSAAFYGDTGGGSVQKNADFGTGNCTGTNSVGYNAVGGGTL